MSISEQVKELREYADILEPDAYFDDGATMISVLSKAADTIETLSAKLAAANMERSEDCGGWILCEDRLPEERPTMFAKLKGTPKWNNCMFETSSDRVNVTVEDDKEKVVTTHAHTIDGRWACDLLKCNKNYKIIAWKPLPEPYHEP